MINSGIDSHLQSDERNDENEYNPSLLKTKISYFHPLTLKDKPQPKVLIISKNEILKDK